jgi:hypothetical protein
MLERKTLFTLPEGTQLRSGPPLTIPTRLLFALGGLFESLGCVSEAFVVQVQYQPPKSDWEPGHLLVEVRMKDETPIKYSEILPQIANTVRVNYPDPDKPVDFMQIGRDGIEKPYAGSQLFVRFIKPYHY